MSEREPFIHLDLGDLDQMDCENMDLESRLEKMTAERNEWVKKFAFIAAFSARHHVGEIDGETLAVGVKAILKGEYPDVWPESQIPNPLEIGA